ncbi:diguanylate cyclase [Geomonas sp.]|uniref:diguanylate cyclase n=1 Tax=Geomonas sp. TaxID=2651584 RepID=UPI002B486896|nr:diguanylate cyclase [Geomonas sp.]HJV34747.1 diguanylate cyclase [Geomonas sp.]
MHSASGQQKVLIIDDTLANIEILHRILQEEYEVYFAKAGADGIRIAKRELPDLILLDIMMPGMDGYQVCTILKADPETENIPVIFITAMGSDEDETKGLDCGAIDYLTKPISPPIVKSRVRNHLELKRSRDVMRALTLELAEKNRELEVLAREDGLTGLANRRHLDQVLDAEVKRAVRSGQELSLIMCDIDFFKKYNDRYGHLAGDKCLQAVGRLLRGSFRRAGDLAARYGGEEFVVVLPDTAVAQAERLAERLRLEVINLGLEHDCSGTGVVTMSMGVVGGVLSRELSPEWMIGEADRALYGSKEKGRNVVTVVGW